MTISIHPFFHKRRAGILLHPTSLPNTPGNGDLGKEAYRFVDFMSECGLSLWQMLPLGPPHADLSPYQCQSVHAANTLLINLESLVKRGWLNKANLVEHPIDAVAYRHACLKETRQGFKQQATIAERTVYAEFVRKHEHWLKDYALFRALKVKFQNAAWWEWPTQYRDREPSALMRAQQELAEQIEQQCFEQFLFFSQWQTLRQYARVKGVYMFGDMPIFVAEDSVDVWAEKENFLLDKTTGRATVVAGVPPDYFSETGQLWGNPHYDWEYMQNNGFQWWINRLRTQEELFDVVRIDHFRGFEASWAVPSGETTAINGNWVKVPGDALFTALAQSDVKELALVAEDLGVITNEVIELRDKFGLPGMKILQFAFDSAADNAYLPHNHVPHCIVYTGTHDNNTTLGWFRELSTAMQQYVCEYLHAHPYDMPWPLVEAAFASVAQIAVVPMQDVLAGDASQRMNIPGTATGNWQWRFNWSQLTMSAREKLHHLSRFYGRLMESN